MPDLTPPYRLITFAPMVGSETARLLLRHYQVAFEENDHLFGWASIVSILNGGGGAIPMLTGRGMTLRGPRAIADLFEPLAPTDKRLRPDDDVAGVDADWSVLNGRFKADIAIFAYYHLLPERALLQPVFAAPLKGLEAKLTPHLYPALSVLFRVLLKLNAANATAAGERVLTTLHSYDARLTDGRPFLRGDRPTLGDFALAGGCAPMIQPPGFGTIMPAIADMPRPMRMLIDAMRETRAVRRVDALYATL